MRTHLSRHKSVVSECPGVLQTRKGKQIMCMSCGCGSPNDTHGDSRNITQDDLNNAAQAANISPQQAAQNIMDTSQQIDVGYSAGRPVDTQSQGYAQGQA